MKTEIVNIECLIAGVKYRMRDYVAAKIKKGDVLVLEAEPTNEYDAFAIKVLKDGVLIGYVPRTHNQLIHMAVANAPEMVKCVVKGAWPAGCMLNITVSVERPDDQPEDSVDASEV